MDEISIVATNQIYVIEYHDAPFGLLDHEDLTIYPKQFWDSDQGWRSAVMSTCQTQSLIYRFIIDRTLSETVTQFPAEEAHRIFRVSDFPALHSYCNVELGVILD